MLLELNGDKDIGLLFRSAEILISFACKSKKAKIKFAPYNLQ